MKTGLSQLLSTWYANLSLPEGPKLCSMKLCTPWSAPLDSLQPQQGQPCVARVTGGDGWREDCSCVKQVHAAPAPRRGHVEGDVQQLIHIRRNSTQPPNGDA